MSCTHPTATASKSRKAAKARGLPEAPALPLTETNEALDSAINAARLTLTRLLRIDRDGPQVDKQVGSQLKRARRALEALSPIQVQSLREAQTKNHAYLMGYALLWSKDEDWGWMSAESAIAVLETEDVIDALANAARTFRLDVAAQDGPPPAPPSGALGAAILAVEAAHSELTPLEAAHTAAEEAYFAAPPGDEKEAAGAAVEARYALVSDAEDAVDATCAALLAAPARTPSDILAKASTLAKVHTRTSAVSDLPIGVAADLAQAMVRDIAGMAPDGPDTDPQWRAVMDAYEAAERRHREARAAYDAAWQKLEAMAPWPDELHDKAGGGFFTFEGSIKEAAELTHDQKVAALAALAEYRPRRDAIEEQLQVDALSDADDVATDAYVAARQALIAAHAPDAAALAFQLRVAVEAIVDLDEPNEAVSPDLENPAHVEELISNYTLSAPFLISIYRNACALAGKPSATADVQAFDPAAWVARFEAYPGHSVTDAGQISYEEFVAWGVDPTPIMITDLEAVARWREFERSRYTEEQWECHPRRNAPLAAFLVGDAQHIEHAYPEGHPEREQLLALWNARLATYRTPPLGAHLWRDLPEWKRKKIRFYARARPFAQQLSPPAGNSVAQDETPRPATPALIDAASHCRGSEALQLARAI